ncbi:tRNA dimethylallyltransferase [Pseudovibrio sp. Tun.PSC04-5.I4]|nr:tRNA dimethylallyltransferase [Pseudovibrio sp. Tun.PSC04-5.I4]
MQVGGFQKKPVAVLIAGPTASGKTALSLRLAKELNASVVNADSMQIYRDLRILSARPSLEEESQAPHLLFGCIESERPYSVMTWLEDFAEIFNSAKNEGRPLVVVGGTGLYFKAALEGISLLPDIPEDVRRSWREFSLHNPTETLHEALRERDSVMADRLEPADTQRIVRALEVIDGTGQSLAHWQTEKSTPIISAGEALQVVLEPDRKVLHDRIQQRFDMMMDQGAVEEASSLWARGMDPNLQVMKAIGVKLLAEAELGKTSLEWAIERSKTETRRYAKRQCTFFRGQLGGWPRLDPLNSHEIDVFVERIRAAFL